MQAEVSEKSPSERVARFGPFTLHLDRLELYRQDRRVNLQPQTVSVLALLVEKAGEVVTREQIQATIWPAGTFVEFELALYTSINRVRRALGDTAASPHYIETLPKSGYRFISPVTLGGDAEREVPEILPIPPPARRRWPLVTGVAIAGLLISAALVYWHSGPAEARQVYRYAIDIPSVDRIESLVISPMGDQVVFEATKGSKRALYRLLLDSTESRLIPGSEEGRFPFFSPDGQRVGFFVPGKLRIANATGATDLVALEPSFSLWGGSWSGDGWITFNDTSQGKAGIWRVRASGGTAEHVLGPLADARGFTTPFVTHGADGPEGANFYSYIRDPVDRSVRIADAGKHEARLVVERGIGAQLLADGHLVYFSAGSLFAAPYHSGTISGTPVRVTTGVFSRQWFSAASSVSRDGTLAYLAAERPIQRRLEWVSRDGRSIPVALPEGAYEQAVPSPDGRMVAVVRKDQESLWTIWVHDFATGAARRIAENEVPHPRIAWSPDSTALVAGLTRGASQFVNLYRLPAQGGGTPERLTDQPSYGQFPLSWSAKAGGILYVEGSHPRSGGDIYFVSLAGNQRPRQLIATPGLDGGASFSLDGAWIAYHSESGGVLEAYVQRFDAAKQQLTGPRIQISESGGRDPAWSPDGRHLSYLDDGRNLVEVSMPGPDGKRPTPHELVHGPVSQAVDVWTPSYNVARDGRFLVARQVAYTANVRINIVVNWFQELRRLSPQ